MSNSQRAKQLLELLESLEPLDEKSRGMPVEASEWNTIIDVLRELLQINRDQDDDLSGRLLQNFAPAEHEHLGEVTLSWLDASLQTRFAEGGDGVATRQALSKMQKVLSGLQAEVARLTELSDSQRTKLDRVEIEELDRKRLLSDFDTRFSGLSNLRTSVNRLARSQGALKEGVDEVLSLGERLTDANGNAIDVSGIAARVNELEDVREALTDINGEPLRLRDLQLDLIELRDTIPSDAGGNLDGRLAELEAGLQGRMDEREAANLDVLRAEIGTGLEANRAFVGTALTDGLATEREAVLERVGELTAASETRFSELINERLDNERAGLLEFARETAFGEVDARLQQVTAGIDARVDSRLDGFADTFRADLSRDIESGVETGLAASEARLTARIEGLDSAVADVQSSLDSRIEGALSDLTPAIEARLAERLDGNLGNVRNDLSAMVSDSVRESVNEMMPGVRRAASEAVADGISGIDQRIEAAVAQSTREVQASVATQIERQIAGLNVSGQIAAANARLEETLRDEISVSVADLQSSNRTALNNALTGLRGEFFRGNFNGGRIVTPIPIGPGR